MLLEEIHTSKDLPTDAEELKTFAWNLYLQYTKLQERLAILTRQQYGHSSEKSVGLDSVQLEMSEMLKEITLLTEFIPESKEESVTVIEIEKHCRRKRNPGRNAIPSHIPTEEKLLEVPDAEKVCECCGEMKLEINRKSHTIVERIPAKYSAIKYIRPVLACPKCKGSISVAEPDASPIPKGVAGPQLLKFVIVSKYLYHLTLYRIQRQIFHESEIWFTRSTMDSWLKGLHKGITRIHKELLEMYRAYPIKHADETHLDVRDSGKSYKLHKGRMWTGVGIDNEGPPIIVFMYQNTRAAKAANKFLSGAAKNTVLMTDACPSYNDSIKFNQLIALNCWAHARRKFVEAMDTGYKVDYAKKIIRQIGALYRVEHWCAYFKLSNANRGIIRQRISVKILSKIRVLIEDPGFVVLPSRKIGEAINYMKHHWIRLARYAEKGEYPIDNNIVERAIRPLTIGRKNWGCAGSEAGADWMAAWYTLIATCRANNINADDYIVDVITRLPLRAPGVSVKDLTPVEWAKAKGFDLKPMVEYPES